MGILRAALSLLLFLWAIEVVMPVTSMGVQLNIHSKAAEGVLFLLLFFGPYFLLGYILQLVKKFQLLALICGFLLCAFLIWEIPQLILARTTRVPFSRLLTEFEKDELQRRVGFPILVETIPGPAQNLKVFWVSEVAFRKNRMHQAKLEEELQLLVAKDKKPGSDTASPLNAAVNAAAGWPRETPP